MATLFLLWLWWRKRRPPIAKKHYNSDPKHPDQHFNDAIIGGDLPRWLSSEQGDRLAELLAYINSDTNSTTLDIPASIEASADKGGIPTLRFHKQRQLQQIVILDSVQRDKHEWNQLPQEIHNALQSRGIHLHYGHYYDSPQQFTDAEGQVQHLADWQQQYPHLLLLIFADTQTQRGILQFDWQQYPEALLFSYHEQRFWDEREYGLLQQEVQLFTATPEAVLRALEQQQSEGALIQPPSYPAYPLDYFVQGMKESDQHYLQRVLGSALPWAEACSLYASNISFAAIEQIRQQYFSHLPREHIQRFLRLTDSWYSHKTLRFSATHLAALRQSFAQRDPAWQQKMVTTWQDLLQQVEPKQNTSLQWQLWQWQRLRLNMLLDTDKNSSALQELYALYATSPDLQQTIRVELARADTQPNPNAIPLATPSSLMAKKQLYAMTGEQTGISKQTAYPNSYWQQRGALFSALLTVIALAMGIWQTIQFPSEPELVVDNDDFKSRAQWQKTPEGYQLHLLNAAQDQPVVNGLITQQQLPAQVTLTTDVLSRPCETTIQTANTNQPAIRLYRCLANSKKQTTRSWRQAILQADSSQLPADRQLSIGGLVHQTTVDSEALRAALLSHHSVDWLLDISLASAQTVDWQKIVDIVQQNLGLWLPKTQLLLVTDADYGSALAQALPNNRLLSLQGDYTAISDVFNADYAQGIITEQQLQQALAQQVVVKATGENTAPALYTAQSLTITDEIIEPEMVLIKQGEFQMGCVSGKDCDDDEKPVHKVTVSAFEMGKYEITNQQYANFLNAVKRRGSEEQPWFATKKENNESCLIENNGVYQVEQSYEKHPMVTVSWYGAKAYLQWLSEQTGKAYRLPTESEWEYAARAGTTTAYWWGDRFDKNKANNSEKILSIGSFDANPWGLYDTSGNAWEWAEDCWHSDYNNAPSDGSAWQNNCSQDGAVRVLRGGSWFNIANNLRSALRYNNGARDRNIFVGFRAARTIKVKNDVLLPKMIDIPQGEFQMGCVSGKDCQKDELPVHKVKLAAFKLSEKEITNEQYVQFLNAVKPSVENRKKWLRVQSEENKRSRVLEKEGQYTVQKGYITHPVSYVSWYGAKAYLQWLTEQTGDVYRLPSEAEWEYAARAGTATPFSTGECIDTTQANYDGNYAWEGCPKIDEYRGDTTPVGEFNPNGYDLYDMHGNVWEWVEDCWHDDYSNAPVDGIAWQENCSQDGAVRVLRGGSWYNVANFLRSANRDDSNARARSLNVGFRAARTN